jgi:hypothetical protein
MNDNGKKARERPKVPRKTYALHFVAPLILGGIGLVFWGVYQPNSQLVLVGIAMEALAALGGVILHSSYRGRKQSRVRCG